MKKEYTTPSVEVNTVTPTDVITTSPWTLPEVGGNW